MVSLEAHTLTLLVLRHAFQMTLEWFVREAMAIYRRQAFLRLSCLT